METARRKMHSRTWLYPLLAVSAVSAAAYLVTWFIDSAGSGVSLADVLFVPGDQSTLSGLPEVVAGVLGITITVVAIIVELAANRYTPRITELFVESPTNLGVLGFFVLSGLLCVWVSLTGSHPGFVPRVGTAVTVFSITACLLLILPYFAFVFSFLTPDSVIDRMASVGLAAVGRGRRGGEAALGRARQQAVRGVEQLADVSLNAIENKDKGICMHAVNALGRLTRDYLAVKPGLPAGWFAMDASLRENPDFVSMQPEVLDDIEAGRFWFEMKVLRQYQMLYGETLNRLRDLNYLIAINTRKIAEEALARGDERAAALTVKFFNTFLRATVNAQDVRTAYNVLNQYRLLAEHALKVGRGDLAIEAATRFKYYGQLGFTSGLHFILETAAYDLCTLNELAFDLAAPCRDELLSIFLEVDKEAEAGHALESSLRGVRKAQVKLATYYLVRGAEDLARRIFDDMRNELPARLASIREELAGITSKDFWEVSDRGGNFDYVDPERRGMLDRFFGWFAPSSGA
jgi:hypothetical protein